MQKVIFIICFAFITNKSISQNLDSILANPPIIELQISNPQPRLGDNLVISYDASFIQGQIFKSALPELIDENDNSDADERKLNLSFKAKKLGKVSVGPFSFTLNGINFRTSNLTYEVINKLPQVAEGVWIRNVKLNDSISCVILEQRIPTERKTESLTPNTTRYWSEPLNKNQVEINYLKNIKGVRKHTSMTNSSEKYIYTDSGERLEFQYILSVAYYEIVDKSIPIEITKDWFNNLPPTYKFENIKIQ